MIQTDKVGRKRPNYFITDEEVKIMWKYSKRWSEKFQVMLGFALFRGLRIGEVCAINIKDFKPDGKLTVKLQKSYIIDDFPLLDDFNKLLQDYIKNNLHTFKNGYLFPYYSHRNKNQKYYMTTEVAGAYMSKFRKIIGTDNPQFLDRTEFNNKIKYRIGWHSCRRWLETKIYDEYANRKTVADIMRYKKMHTVDTYLDCYDTWKQEKQMLEKTFKNIYIQCENESKGQAKLSDF